MHGPSDHRLTRDVPKAEGSLARCVVRARCFGGSRRRRLPAEHLESSPRCIRKRLRWRKIIGFGSFQTESRRVGVLASAYGLFNGKIRACRRIRFLAGYAISSEFDVFSPFRGRRAARKGTSGKKRLALAIREIAAVPSRELASSCFERGRSARVATAPPRRSLPCDPVPSARARPRCRLPGWPPRRTRPMRCSRYTPAPWRRCGPAAPTGCPAAP